MPTSSLQTYAAFRPTSFDTAGLGCDDRQHWMVAPVAQDRDSDTLTRSNFRAVLSDLGGESATVEVRRFGHWANGWFEVILIDRADTVAVAKAELWADRLADYCVASEEDWSSLELEEADSAWAHMSLRSRMEACARCGVSIFAARRDEVPSCATGEMDRYLADGC